MIEAEGFPGMALIMGGTLDDPSWLKPTMALFCELGPAMARDQS